MTSHNKTTPQNREAGDNLRILRPKDWERFQHYKRRRPPWIKLHKDLLDNYEFVSLPIASKALAPLLWLLASESETGEIPYDSTVLAFRLRIDSALLADAMEPLINKGFFTVASTALARCWQHATPETETDRRVPSGANESTELAIEDSARDEVLTDPHDLSFMTEDASGCNVEPK